ncbi:PEP-CTERM sorting domain-containing protein [Coraliomargarita sinensis]|uniref:PEP-CTERM sorting domain-containing protein n=1 Tax=Coraliomargarita sinensis TaxID=2174842 RepID=UPI001E478174|nr:PEP-CTERM sorting domain-containing protein [Coraliomargarita sinensis]
MNADADGFTGWTEQNTSGTASQNGRFIGSSGTGLDVNGDAWGLYANSNQTAANVYTFGGSLGVGETVSIDISLGFIDTGGTVGFGLQNSSGTNRLETYYIGGSTDSWKINDAGGQEDITGPSTSFVNSSWSNNNFLEFQFTQLASNEYALSIGGSAITNSNLTLAASDISQIRIFNFNAGSNGVGGHDQYFNSLEVVPEPSSFALIAGFLGFIYIAVRRRGV